MLHTGGQYITTVSARFPHRMAAAASLYGVLIVTDKPDSPHLLVDKIKGELSHRFRPNANAIADHVIPDLRAALAKTDVKNTISSRRIHGFALYRARGLRSCVRTNLD